MGIIRVNGIKLYAYHGVLNAEKELGQYFVTDIAVYTDLKQAGQSDNVVDTVNYAEIYTLVEKIVRGKSVNLIEHLADKIIINVFEQYSMINKVSVTITKPNPPIDGTYKDVSVTLEREREK